MVYLGRILMVMASPDEKCVVDLDRHWHWHWQYVSIKLEVEKEKTEICVRGKRRC